MWDIGDIQLTVRHYSACDADPACRQLLMASSPQIEHVFGNILDRWPSDLTEAITTMQSKAVTSMCQGAAAEVRPPADMWKTHGDAFLREAATHLLCEDVASQVRTHAWCYRHSMLCPLHPEVLERTLRCELAGNTCTPWSASGNRQGWLDKASVPSLCWGMHLSVERP